MEKAREAAYAAAMTQNDFDFDVVGIGNALVDVIASVEDAFVEAHGFPHGATTMVDLDRAEAVYADLPPAQEISGGSCANTIAGLASFGASAPIGGTVQVPVHIDCVVAKPNLSIDGEPLTRGGELLV